MDNHYFYSSIFKRRPFFISSYISASGENVLRVNTVGVNIGFLSSVFISLISFIFGHFCWQVNFNISQHRFLLSPIAQLHFCSSLILVLMDQVFGILSKSSDDGMISAPSPLLENMSKSKWE